MEINEQAVEGQEEGQVEGQVEGQAAETTVETTVPRERFEDIQARLRAAEETNELLSQQSRIIAANQPKPTAEKPFDIYAHVGLDPDDPDDVPNQAQLKQIQEYNTSQINSRLNDLQFLSTHPDYHNIVGSHEDVRAGKFAPPLAKMLKNNPALFQVIATSKNPSEAAYQIAKTAAGKPADKPAGNEDDEITEAVKNALALKSSSNATGGGALSAEGRYEAMDDATFVELARKNGAPI